MLLGPLLEVRIQICKDEKRVETAYSPKKGGFSQLLELKAFIVCFEVNSLSFKPALYYFRFTTYSSSKYGKFSKKCIFLVYMAFRDEVWCNKLCYVKNSYKWVRIDYAPYNDPSSSLIIELYPEKWEIWVKYNWSINQAWIKVLNNITRTFIFMHYIFCRTVLLIRFGGCRGVSRHLAIDALPSGSNS